jgi:DNA replication licensing factor MCM5
MLDLNPTDTLRPQVILRSKQQPLLIRDLHSDHVGKLVVVPGIIISASKTNSKPTQLQLVCRFCGKKKSIPAAPGFQSTPLPLQCDSQLLREETNGASGEGAAPAIAPGAAPVKCGGSPYMVLGDECEFVDQQILKLQESPEEVPTGEMPRHLRLSAERYLVANTPPGSRVIVTGIYSVSQSGIGEKGTGENVSVRPGYLHIVGINVDEDGSGRSLQNYTHEEEQRFIEFSRTSNVYELISQSIAPAIYGHEDKKKAIACLLFGGSTKHLPDGMRIRGDINVLLLGDPGTAKSQFLKFVERAAPIGVYTSGKGSSAAGLTASVIREPQTKEYYLEGGAMVLADGGVVCIDEFDKMHTHDRVAIHEAMEQQTISIAKAGITTILNARTSVLAAANPIFGSYDDMRTPVENIEFQSTILSRFDMIFVVRDHRNEERDRTIAGHVMAVHTDGNAQSNDSGVEVTFLKRYIGYCRTRCAPVLTQRAADVLRNHYVTIRSSVNQRNTNGKQSAIPITVRQLEAIVRISESIAKMSLSPITNEEHVNEAIRLFKSSTLEAALVGASSSENLPPELMNEVNQAELLLKRRLPISARGNTQKIMKELEYKHVSPPSP